MKVLLYSDNQGWIVDRISKRMREICGKYGVGIDIASYRDTIPAQFPQGYDLIHFNNWDIYNWQRLILSSKTPVLVTVRSFRYPEWIPSFLMENGVHTHVINKGMLGEFPKATYIPDGIFTEDLPTKKEFVVGMVFQDTSDQNRYYKGYTLVKEVCDRLGIVLKVAGGELPVKKMREFYNSVDLVVVASQNEGHNTIALECAAMNKPLLTTNVGLATELNLHKFERTTESLTNEISKFYTSPQVIAFTWEELCLDFINLYGDIINGES